MVYFEGTPSYERHKDYFEERRLKLAAALGRYDCKEVPDESGLL